ncbi:MAG: alkylated DNA nucleotide flippase Atl1 [Planctomycetota bacterium]|jgi:alkylated DNA nucleotide flippase Atl1
MKQPSGLFSQRIWELALSIPPGHVTTYGDIARGAGGGGQAARSVTSILSRAPHPERIPFHRIVYSGGRVWLSSMDDCAGDRMKLYKKEGINIDEKGRIKDFENIRMQW